MVKKQIGRYLLAASLYFAVTVHTPAKPAAMYLPLFIIERSINANVVHYDAKLSDDGNLDPQEPVVAYWIMAAKDGHRQELNLLERVKAYGFTVHPDASGKFYHMELVSQRRRDIHVYRDGDVVRAETLIAGQPAYLQKVFVSARHLVLLPTPEYVEMFGIDVKTGAPRSEKLLPGR